MSLIEPDDPLDDQDVEPGGEADALRHIAANLRHIAASLTDLARVARYAADEFGALVDSMEREP